MSFTAFVTDGDQRSALAITRSLGRRGASVLVGEEQPRSLASSSRYCARHVTYPSPHRDPQGFQAFLADFVRRERVDVVVPVTDVTASSVSLHKETLAAHTAIAAPAFAAFDQVTDKAALVRSAERCGIKVPRTLVAGGIDDLRAIVGRVQYPAVVKSARSRIFTGEGWVRTGVHYADSERELRRLYEQTAYLLSHPSLIQQRIVGPGIGVFGLFDRGRLLTAFAHKRLREKPPSGGVSVLCESIPVDPRLREEAVRLLGPLGWDGVAMLEYKRDEATGECFLMEVNGRFWGSLQLAIDAGVDFPYLSCELAQGRRPDLPHGYRVGLKNRWLLGDLDHLIGRLGNAREDLFLPAETPSRWRALIEFVSCTRPGVRDQVVSGDDPLPFLYELREYVRSLGSPAVRRLRHAAARAGIHGLRVASPSIPSQP